MVDILNILAIVSSKLKARVSDFIFHCQWCLPVSFRRAFPNVVMPIKRMDFFFAKRDSLVWTPTTNGCIIFKSAYDVSKSDGRDFKWMVSV